MMDDLVMQNTFTVTTADADMYGRLHLGGLVNFLIQSAINSADNLGFGFKDLAQNKLFWVLSRLTVEIYKPVLWSDTLIVETWPKSTDRLFYIRDFIIYDKHGTITAKATSAWLAVDLKSKRPKMIEGVSAERFTRLKEKHALVELPIKLPAITDGEIFNIEPQYCDFDLNRHVTSTSYVDWMTDMFSPSFHAEHYPKHLSINYLKETPPHLNIVLKKAVNSLGEYAFEGYHSDSTVVSFRGLVSF